MPSRNLENVVLALKRALRETEHLSGAAQQWAASGLVGNVPRFTRRHQEIVIRLAFLQAFISWEKFLDESFTLYLLGMKPPRGRAPGRLHKPARRKDAERLITGANDYADWAKIGAIRSRAKKYFRNGRPFDQALSGSQNLFDDINTIRNAIAHSSRYSQEKFKALARRNLAGTYPPRLSIGKFLVLNNPRSQQPETFLQFYLTRVILVAEQIVPH